MNMAMIEKADGVVANLDFFRGHEPDSGTCFEVGMAVALKKPVFAYFSNHDPLVAQVPHGTDGRDAQGMLVEDFNLPRNLMLACTWAGTYQTAEEAIQAAAAYLNQH